MCGGGVLQGIQYSGFSTAAALIANAPLHNFATARDVAAFKMLRAWAPCLRLPRLLGGLGESGLVSDRGFDTADGGGGDDVCHLEMRHAPR
jgi:hypothetical protein